jgi:ABC-type multidrug transport system fused ATPase/permease subunit
LNRQQASPIYSSCQVENQGHIARYQGQNYETSDSYLSSYLGNLGKSNSWTCSQSNFIIQEQTIPYLILKALIQHNFTTILLTIISPFLLKKIIENLNLETCQLNFKPTINLLKFILLVILIFFQGPTLKVLIILGLLNLVEFFMKRNLIFRLKIAKKRSHIKRLIYIFAFISVLGSLSQKIIYQPCSSISNSNSNIAATVSLQSHFTSLQIMNHTSDSILYFLLFQFFKLPEYILETPENTIFVEILHRFSQRYLQQSQEPQLIIIAVFNLLLNLFVVVLACSKCSFLGFLLILLYFLEILRFYEKKSYPKKSKFKTQSQFQNRPTTSKSKEKLDQQTWWPHANFAKETKTKTENIHQNIHNFGFLGRPNRSSTPKPFVQKSSSDREDIYCCQHDF